MVKALRLTEEQYAAALKRQAPAHKFGAQKTDGYDSKLEARRAHVLEFMERSGMIVGLRTQVEFILVDAQYAADGELIERPASYVADFVYIQDGATVVEDCKGYCKGTAYRYFVLKRKLMLQRHGLRVIEISK